MIKGEFKSVASVKASGSKHKAAMRQAKIPERANGGGARAFGHLGGFLAMRASVAPPLENYEAWLSQTRSTDPRSRGRRAVMTASKLRRAVVMRRGGETFKEIGDAIGFSAQAISTWLSRLPKELQP